jgi:hypothetical protein
MASVPQLSAGASRYGHLLTFGRKLRDFAPTSSQEPKTAFIRPQVTTKAAFLCHVASPYTTPTFSHCGVCDRNQQLRPRRYFVRFRIFQFPAVKLVAIETM